jgi:hypothetical protein
MAPISVGSRRRLKVERKRLGSTRRPDQDRVGPTRPAWPPRTDERPSLGSRGKAAPALPRAPRRRTPPSACRARADSPRSDPPLRHCRRSPSPAPGRSSCHDDSRQWPSRWTRVRVSRPAGRIGRQGRARRGLGRWLERRRGLGRGRVRGRGGGRGRGRRDRRQRGTLLGRMSPCVRQGHDGNRSEGRL